MKIINHIITHAQPHLDELLALYFLWSFGSQKFILENSTWDEMLASNLGKKTWRDYPGRLFVGCGESPYDEHGKGDLSSSCRLVAKDLGLSFDIFGTLVKQVEHEDRNGAGKTQRHLAAVVKQLFREGYSKEEVYDWVSKFFDAVHSSERKLIAKVQGDVMSLNLSSKAAEDDEIYARLNATRRPWFFLNIESCAKLIAQEEGKEEGESWLEFGLAAMQAKQKRFKEAMEVVENGEIYTIHCSVVSGKRIDLVVVESDNDQVGPASRKQGFQVCIQKSDDTIIILGDLKFGIKMHGVAAKLRRAELDKQPEKEWKLTGKQLWSEGSIKDVPEWHLHEGNIPNIYNGSLTRPCADPTRLTREEVVEIVIKTLTTTPDRLPQNRDKSPDNNIGVGLERTLRELEQKG